MKKSRWQLQIIILSGALNLLLLGIFFYFLFFETPLQLAYLPKERLAIASFEHLEAIPNELLEADFETLVAKLSCQTPSVEGYPVKEIVLGLLSHSHHLDVERALGKSLTKTIEEGVPLFQGLNDKDFKKIQEFCQLEKWPFTPEGLYLTLSQSGIEKSDPELIDFFCYTPQFILLETLMARTKLPLQKRHVLQLALESSWELMQNLYEEQQAQADFSTQAQVAFLQDAYLKGSIVAAKILKALNKRQLYSALGGGTGS